jgi:tight adherence protein B
MNPSMGVVPIAVTVFLTIGMIGFLIARGSVVFMQRYRDTFTEQARHNLADMFLFIDPRTLFQFNIGAVLLVPLVVWVILGNLLLALGVVVLILFLPRKIYTWLRQRRLLKVQAQLPDGLMMMASSMRAGLGFGPAMESLAKDIEPPLAEEFSLILREQRMGVKPDEALEHFNVRVPIPDVTLFVSAVNISRDIGGNLAESLALLSETLRRRLIMEGKIRALTAQGRLQGIVMALMPVGIATFLTFAYPDTMHGLYHTLIGWCVMALAAVMEFLGYRMCRKIMSIDV